MKLPPSQQRVWESTKQMRKDQTAARDAGTLACRNAPEGCTNPADYIMPPICKPCHFNRQEEADEESERQRVREDLGETWIKAPQWAPPRPPRSAFGF